MSTAIRSLDQLERVSSSVSRLAGYALFFRLSHLKVSRGALSDLLIQHGFMGVKLPILTEKEALGRAVRQWVKSVHGNSSEASTSRTLIRPINSSGSDYATYALVLEEADFDALGLSHHTSLRVLYHKQDRSMLVTHTAQGMTFDQEQKIIATIDEAGDAIARYWTECKDTLTGDDLSPFLVDLLQAQGAVRLRDKGGLYYVPAHQGEIVLRFKALVASLGSGCYATAIGIPDEDKESISRAVHDGILSDIETERYEIARIIERRASGTEIRDSTIDTHVKRYTQLLTTYQAHKASLGIQQTEADQAFDALKAMTEILID